MGPQRRLQGWIKRHDRKPVRFDTWMVLPDESRVEVRVTNISYDGCRIGAEQILPIGKKVIIALPKIGEIEAQVRWSLLGEAGLQFLLAKEEVGSHHLDLGVQPA